MKGPDVNVDQSEGPKSVCSLKTLVASRHVDSLAISRFPYALSSGRMHELLSVSLPSASESVRSTVADLEKGTAGELVETLLDEEGSSIIEEFSGSHDDSGGLEQLGSLQDHSLWALQRVVISDPNRHWSDEELLDLADHVGGSGYDASGHLHGSYVLSRRQLRLMARRVLARYSPPRTVPAMDETGQTSLPDSSRTLPSLRICKSLSCGWSIFRTDSSWSSTMFPSFRRTTTIHASSQDP